MVAIVLPLGDLERAAIDPRCRSRRVRGLSSARRDEHAGKHGSTLVGVTASVKFGTSFDNGRYVHDRFAPEIPVDGLLSFATKW